QLAVHVVPFCKHLNAIFPWGKGPFADARLGNMIQNEYLIGMAVNKLDSLRQVTLEYQNVVGKAARMKLVHPPIEVFSKHVKIVRFVMQNMAYTFKSRVLRESIQRLLDARIDERHPSNDTANKRTFGGQLKKPLRFRERLPRLYCDTALNVWLLKCRTELRNEEIAPEGLHCSRHPDIIEVIIFPEVMMSIDPHASNSTPCRLLAGGLPGPPPPGSCRRALQSCRRCDATSSDRLC